MHDHPPRRQRGVALLEALIAFVVLSLGMLAIGRLQTHLRLDADVARQRSEAVRLAQEDIEAQRAFSVLAAAPGRRSFETIASASNQVAAGAGDAANVHFLLTRRVEPATGLQAKDLGVRVDWTDRSGSARQVALETVVAGIAPALSGALGLAGDGAPARGPFGRSVRLPREAKDLGDGRSVLKPVSSGTVAFVFDHTSGLLTARCAGVPAATATGDLTTADLGLCDARVGHLLSGVVRFSSATPPDTARGNDAPLAFAVALTLAGDVPAAPSCSVEPVSTPAGDRYAVYRCAVYPGADGRWSGRAVLVPDGWAIGTGAGAHRVCRDSTDLDRSGAIDANIEHPDSYAEVDASLPNQNFLVIPTGQACPVGRAVRVAGNNGDVYVDLGTTQHQP
jgi:Tfp pilus assembly protein PilV